MKKSLYASVAGAVLFLAAPVYADSISPSSVTATIPVGGHNPITKVVTVTAGTPTAGLADVLFIVDTTGSMGSTISSVQADLLTLVNAYGPNVGFGVAEYKDKSTGGDAFDYKLDQVITTNHATVQTALNGLSAGGGGDTPEQGLFAMQQGAAAATGWRAGAKKIEVIVGDAPSHDGLHPTAPAGVTVASTKTILNAAAITAEAVDVGALNSYGQFSGASSIFGGVGPVSGGYSTSTSGAAAAINAAIAAAFNTYTDVGLQLVGAPAGVTVTLGPDQIGAFDRSITRTFNFAVDFAGTAPGVYNFSINALVDGGIVATETDTITVPGASVPEPASLALLGVGLFGLGWVRRRKA